MSLMTIEEFAKSRNLSITRTKSLSVELIEEKFNDEELENYIVYKKDVKYLTDESQEILDAWIMSSLMTFKQYADTRHISYEAVRKSANVHMEELEPYIHTIGKTRYITKDGQELLDRCRMKNIAVVQDAEQFEKYERLLEENKALLKQIASLQEDKIELIEVASKVQGLIETSKEKDEKIEKLSEEVRKSSDDLEKLEQEKEKLVAEQKKKGEIIREQDERIIQLNRELEFERLPWYKKIGKKKPFEE